jgi:hypothetical protein
MVKKEELKPEAEGRHHEDHPGYFDLSRRVANVIEQMVMNGFPHSEKLTLSRLVK